MRRIDTFENYSYSTGLSEKKNSQKYEYNNTKNLFNF